MHVIATAGHVDHGKSTLIRFLTGIDPDRLAEEKARGLTIDLGFAWLDLPSGTQIGIVDVPGHGRFIKNMLAGVGAVDATLFVVAANEGWKPQSQEHLDILDLLQVRTAVVAVTKSDTVGEEELELVIGDVRTRIATTTLASAEIIAVSATTGNGTDRLVQELDRLLTSAPAPEDISRPRLWIDRSFTIKGSGTVVTGTLLEGGLEVGQEVEILPANVRARIRSIQSHQKEVDKILPGDRTALNLSGIEHRGLRRGDVLTLPGTHETTNRLLVEARFLGHLHDDPPERGAFKMYAGSIELEAEMRLLGEAGGFHIVLVRTDQPAPIMFGDRVILRESGRQQTIGGGRVIEAHPMASDTGPDLVRKATARMGIHHRSQYAALLLDENGFITKEELERRSGHVGDVEGASRGKRFWFSNRSLDDLAARIQEALGAHHANHPLEVGMPSVAVRSMTGMNEGAFEEAVSLMVARGAIAQRGTALAMPGFAPDVGGQERTAVLEELGRAGASVPTLDELSTSYPVALVRALVRSGDLTQVSPELFYPTAFIDDLKRTLREHVIANGPFTVAVFRDLIGTTRKYAVPLLEFLDQQGFTRRNGDLRELAGTTGS